MSTEHAPWIVVLAGGAGTRLCSLTVDGDGRQPCAERLRVLAIPECGWTDLGTPRRVAECLARQAGHASPAAVPGQIVLAEALRGGAADGSP